MKSNFDLITIGGGLGGAALAKRMAENGARVLVVERERQFFDRIRGEWVAPWGVAEAQKIGIYEVLLERCAVEAPYVLTLGMGPIRDLRSTTPQKLPALTFHHPEMQEALIRAAEKAGAETWRGAVVRRVQPGEPPAVTVERDGHLEDVKARLVVCADGRSSMGRQWGGFATSRAKQKLLGAGLVFEKALGTENTLIYSLNPTLQRAALALPIGHGLVRGYLIYRESQIERLQGAGDVSRFVDECIRSGLPSECFVDARVVGPLASFDMTESWVEHPYRDGVGLIGDAAGSSDPSWGQGLSITMRDVRLLSQNLLAGDDWELACNRYAEARTDYFKRLIRVHEWIFDLFLGDGPAADKQRERALPLLAAQPDRMPDHNFSGPEMNCDANVRRRLFGEN
jgi:2-polyprenyl-6-methoxyphenol hydroxylase-like FAD-dependent oxidoreductase